MLISGQVGVDAEPSRLARTQPSRPSGAGQHRTVAVEPGWRSLAGGDAENLWPNSRAMTAGGGRRCGNTSPSLHRRHLADRVRPFRSGG
ncbi:hypothetical protein DSL92_03785 [Billgrantia gudaonensis]|uniref:Uncharacterized protein n=1 Tax=Billgrantia gudaonensis TaxID=376427 RepID=A0A3S0NE75_9GAMM|nr:hypothetical protein DSL92_03785 [Halomonas gudaonensis]